MADRNPARVLAPLSLVAAVISVAVVVALSHTEGSDGGPLTRTVATQSHTTRPARDLPRVYVVKAGDSLSVIADKTGQTIEEIERLNPGIDPQTLQTGERLKLVP